MQDEPRSERTDAAGDLPRVTQAFPGLGQPAPGLDPGELLERLDAIAGENDHLRDELGRCYRHLGVVFEITEKIADQQDPEKIEQELFRCYREMTGATALLLANDDEQRRIDDANDSLDVAVTCQALAEEIRSACAQPRSFCLRGNDPRHATPDGQHVLIGTFRTSQSRLAALVAIRPADERPFDTGDQLVSETVLAYGGHILSNALMVRRIQRSALETVCAFANAVDARDAYTRGHSERVGWLARLIGEEAGLTEQQQSYLEWAGILHDVGKIGVPEEILNKPGALSGEEFERIKEHPRRGYEVLRPVSSLEPILEAVLYHHEDWDGTGYPEGLDGERIPLFARVLRVADTFDALTSSRTYRSGLGLEKALALIEREAGKAFDPFLATRFVAAIRQAVADRNVEFLDRFGKLIEDATDAEPVDGSVE